MSQDVVFPISMLSDQGGGLIMKRFVSHLKNNYRYSRGRLAGILISCSLTKRRVKKNLEKLCPFDKSQKRKRDEPLFWKSIFSVSMQNHSRTPKQVLHLVWSTYVLFTANETTFKIAQRSQIMRKRRPVL